MSIQDNRQKNLNLLAYEFSSRTSVGELLGISHEEITAIYKKNSFFLTDLMARELERTANKPNGWMDRENYDLKLTGNEHELLDIYRNASIENKMLILEMAKLISVRN